MGKKAGKKSVIDADVQRRMHTVDRVPDEEGNPYASGGTSGGVGSRHSLPAVQSADPHSKGKGQAADGGHWALGSYRSVHADQFRAYSQQHPDGQLDEDTTLVGRLDPVAEREAYKGASYQARLRIERASQHANQAAGSGQNPSGIAIAGVGAAGMAAGDPFALINADNSYMDDELDGKGAAEGFLRELDRLHGGADGPAGALANGGGGDAPLPTRSTGFNEVIENPYEDESVRPGAVGGAHEGLRRKNDYAPSQDTAGAGTAFAGPADEDGGDSMAFGEQFGELDDPGSLPQSERASVVGDAGLKFSLTDKLRQAASATGSASIPAPLEDREEDNAEEAADQVPEMPAADFFDRP